MVALLTLMNPLGTMVGFVIPLIFVNTDDTIDNMQNQFLRYMISEAISAGAILVLTFVFFRGDKEMKKDKSLLGGAQNPESVQLGTGTVVQNEQ